MTFVIITFIFLLINIIGIPVLAEEMGAGYPVSVLFFLIIDACGIYQGCKNYEDTIPPHDNDIDSFINRCNENLSKYH